MDKNSTILEKISCNEDNGGGEDHNDVDEDDGDDEDTDCYDDDDEDTDCDDDGDDDVVAGGDADLRPRPDLQTSHIRGN